MHNSLATWLFRAVTRQHSDDGGLSGEAAHAEPKNFLAHALSLGASKVADGLVNPKLVLSWLLTHLGAGSVWVGLLVPARESLALLPQLLTAPHIAAQPRRKWFWAGGAVVQGICAGAIAVAGLTLQGAAAGAVIVALLAVLALARSVCSASYKDVLGKTIGTSRRGTVTGLASSVAASAVIAFALALTLGAADRYGLVIAALLLASALWIAGGLLFTTIQEEASAQTKAGGTAAQLAHLREDQHLVRFIAIRCLLVGTALAPPYLVMLGSGAALERLGALVLAAALASLVSSFVWGRLSDRSSRRVLLHSGLAGGSVLAGVVAGDWSGLLDLSWVPPILLFVLMMSYEGVRQGRSTHLVDMAKDTRRASYTALSNTCVGLFLIATGGAAAALSSYSPRGVVALFSVMCFVAAWLARGLDEVQRR